MNQFATNGSQVSTLQVPSQGPNALVVDDTYTAGFMTLSPNGQFLVLPGYNVSYPAANNVASAASGSAPRAVATVDGGGNFLLQIVNPNIFSGIPIRDAVFDGVSNFWVCGGAASGNLSGVVYVGTPGATNVGTLVGVTGTGNERCLNIFNNILYVDTDQYPITPPAVGVYSITGPSSPPPPTGLPTNAPSQLITESTSTSPFDFAINPSNNIAYVADSVIGEIIRFTNTGSSWISDRIYNVGGSGPDDSATGLTVDFTQSPPVIYATTSGTTNGNRLIRIVDQGPGSPVTVLATSTANGSGTNFFRGVRLVPGTPPSILMQPTNVTQVAGQSASFTVSATGSVTLDYQWSVNGTNIVGATNSVLTFNNLTMSNNGNYQVVVSNGYGTITSAVATLSVTQAAPLVTWSPSNINYGVALGANQLNATASVSGVFSYNPPTNTVLDSGTRSLSVIFTPLDTNDYFSSTNLVFLVVQTVPLAVTANSSARPYGQANPVFTGSIVGLVNGDNITANYTSTASTGSPFGVYPISPSLVDPNSRATNYNISLNNGALTVGLVSSNDPTLQAPLYLAGLGSGLVATGTNTSNSPGIFSLPAGSNATFLYQAHNPLQIAVFGTNLYWIDPNSSPSHYMQIFRAPVNGGPTNIVYTGGPFGPLFAGSGLAADDTGLYATDETNGAVFSLRFNGNSLTPIQVGTNRYSGVPLHLNTLAVTNGIIYIAESGQGAVSPQVVSIATNGSAFTTLASGLPLVSPAGIAVGSNGVVYVADPGAGNTIWQIPVSGGAPVAFLSGAPFVYLAGLTVNNGVLYIADPGAGAVYAAAVSAPTIPTVSAIITWNNPASITYGTPLTSIQLNATANTPGNFVYTPPAGSVLDAGSYPLTVIFNPSNTSYYLPATNTVSLQVTPAPLTVIASNAARPINQANPPFTGAIIGIQNGDNITATYSTAATPGSPAGNYPIVPALVDPDNRLSNYTTNIIDGTLSIGTILSWTNPAPIYYGTALGLNQLDATANVPGAFAYTPGFGALLHPGTYTLNVTFTPSNGLYNVATTNASLTVLPAPLTVTAANANRGLGQTNPPFTATIVGLQNGDVITATAYSTATTNSPVGSYPIMPVLVDRYDLETNYTVTLVNGTLMVTLLPSSSYTEAYTFTTLAGYPGFGTADGVDSEFNNPSGVAVDGAGNVYVADTGNDTIRKITSAGVASTMAGVPGEIGSSDGDGDNALFNYPSGLAVDGSSNVYVADTYNSTIRLITSAGVVSTLAGDADNPGNQDGVGGAAQFNYPTAIAVDGQGNLYVADSGNNTIRKVTLANGQWVVSTIVDNNGAVIQFNNPSGIAVDANGNLYVADTGNDVIKEIANGGVVTVGAGQLGVPGAKDGAGGTAQFNGPLGVATDGFGNLYVTDSANNTVRKLSLSGSTWNVTTMAGSVGKAGHADGTGAAASFNDPLGVAAGANGELYLADSKNGLIRQVSSAGVVSTVAGSTGGEGSADGPGDVARFALPAATAVDGMDNVYVADTVNNIIRRVTSAGIVTTYAGTAGSVGSADGAGSLAQFDSPSDIAVDASGSNVYVSDTGNATIRLITPAQVVSTIAGLAGNVGAQDGAGPVAQFDYPTGLAIDTKGNLYVADTYNSTIRMITPAHMVSTIAGTAQNFGSSDGAGGNAQFEYPSAIAVDTNGNLYVADTFNDTIRKISPSGPTWFVTTIAGAPQSAGYSDGPSAVAQFNLPQGIGIDAAGNLYIADTGNQTIRMMAPSGVTWQVSTIGGTNGAQPGSQDGTGSAARFYHPEGITSDAAGTVFVADTDNNTIRKGTFAQYAASKVPAYTQPTMSGGLCVTLLPGGQWQFAGDLFWRNSGAIVNNLAPGSYSIQLAAPPGYAVPSQATVTVTNNLTNYWTSQCYPGPGYGNNVTDGQLTVTLVNGIGGWGFLGSVPPYGSSSSVSLSPGTYQIGFQPVPGYVTPPNLSVQVTAGQPTSVPIVYSVAPAPPAGVSLPVAVAPDDMGAPPYVFNGQLETDVGYGSGVAAQDNVVLTAAHLVFNDNTLNYVTNADWFLQEENGLPQPDPRDARGCYVLSGYAAQRTNDSLNAEWSPGESTAQSRNMDVAALYFESPVANGGYGGYLPSSDATNEWLTGSANKMLTGYPVDGSQFGVDDIVPGALYVTGPQHSALSLDTESTTGQQEVYVGSWFLSYPGNSGGPFYVELNGSYYPAGVYLGTLYSGNQPVGSAIRAIDSNVVAMLADAQALGASGTNSSGGGTETFVADQGVAASSVFGVSISPLAALTDGGAWEFVGQNGTEWSSSTTTSYQSVSSSASNQLEFMPLTGWNSPVNVPSVTVVLGQNPSPVSASYTLELSWALPTSMPYGTSLPAAVTVLSGIQGSYAYTDQNQTQYAPGQFLLPGSYTLTASFMPNDSVDYGGAATLSLPVQVTKATLTVTADNATTVYGNSIPPDTVNGGLSTISGVLGQSFAASFTVSPTLGGNPQVGTYTITPSLLDPQNLLPNYQVSINPGTLTIAQAPAPIHTNYYMVTNQSIPRFATIPVAGSVTARITCPTANGGVAGSYPLVASLIGTGSGNYYVANTPPGYLFVLPLPQMKSAQIAAGAITFTWPSVAGATYLVQATGSISPPNWTNISTNIAAGSSVTVDLPLNARQSQQYYRITSGSQ